MFSATPGTHGTILLKGRFDASQVDAARSVFDAVQDSRTIDCTDLAYISSAGMGVLLMTQKRLSAAGASLRFVNLNPHIREIFRYAGFDKIFEME